MSIYRKPASLHEIDFVHYLHHCRALLWRWKWWILGSTPFAVALCAALILRAQHTVPPLAATATLGLEPMVTMIQVEAEDGNGNKQSVENAPMDSLAQIAQIKSGEFLGSVAENLSLRLTVRNHARSSIFDSVRIDSAAVNGQYRFSVDRRSRNYAVYRQDTAFNPLGYFDAECVASGSLDRFDSRRIPGAFLHFRPEFLAHPKSFRFSILSLPMTVENLSNALSVCTSSPRPSNQHPSFSITNTGTDYPLITQVVNRIADKFVERNFGQRQQRLQSSRDIIARQISVARNEVVRAEQELKDFRTQNPTVGLTRGTEELLANSQNAKATMDSIGQSIEEAQRLAEKLSRGDKDVLPEQCSEVLTFLTFQKDNAAPYLASELTRLLDLRHLQDKPLAAYDENHPLLVKSQAEIGGIIEKTGAELKAFIQRQQGRLKQQQAEAQGVSMKIQTLPGKELRLAELTQLQKVKADVYEKVLDKYYARMVSNIVDLPDMYVMDYAAVPIPGPAKTTGTIALGVFLALLLVFGPIIAADLAAKTVRSEQELRRILDFDILECIPTMAMAKKPGDGVAAVIMGEKPSGKRAFRNEYVKEVFRLLRIKILLRLIGGNTEKTMVITSLDAHAGKSTIAANVAIALAEQNLKTVLIDGDLRLGTLHHLFKCARAPGLSDYLGPAGGSMEHQAIIQPTATPNLFVIPSGNRCGNAAELLSSERLGLLIRKLADQFAVVLFDSPPVGIMADAISVHQHFSHYLFVARAGRTNIMDLRDKIETHAPVKAKLMGVVLNCSDIDGKARYYKRSKYYANALKEARG